MAGARLSTCPVRLLSDPDELAQVIDRARALAPRRILEVGSLYGGTLWHWMDQFTGATVVSVDLVPTSNMHPRVLVTEARALWQRWAAAHFCRLHTVEGRSSDLAVLETAAIYAPFDFIYIDGGHRYEEVDADYHNYWPMLRPGGLMAFHDAESDDYTLRHVRRWWADFTITTDCRTELIRGKFGTGLAWKEPTP